MDEWRTIDGVPALMMLGGGLYAYLWSFFRWKARRLAWRVAAYRQKRAFAAFARRWDLEQSRRGFS